MEEIVIQTNSGITINLDVNVKSVIYVKKKKCFWNPATYNCENEKI